nr:hypothetical protein [Tanacetum cinerariifolium]
MFDCDELISSESDVSMPTSPVYDRYKSGDRHVVPTTVLTRSGLVLVNAARHVNTDVHQTKVQHQRPTKYGVNKAYLPIRSPINLRPSPQTSNFHQKVTTVKANQTNDVVRLQALIDRRKVIITEETVRQALRLDDADSINCLPNEEMFVQLARMGYEKPLIKLTFYKAFFSAQWKFLIHKILQCMSAK